MKRKNSTAILAFVPAIHKGYIKFFKGHKGDIFIMGDKLMRDYVHISRDLRVMKAADTEKALAGLLPGRTIRIAELADLKSWSYSKTLLPEDEIMEDLAKRFFYGKRYTFINVFLRWNKIITARENAIQPNRKISRKQYDREMIKAAFKEASKSSDWWRQIAAMIIKDGEIIFSAHNHHLPSDFDLSVNGDPRSNWNAGEHQNIYTSIHAEAAAVAKAAKDGVSLEGATIYVTTFPCPNCARLLGLSGIKKLYYSKGYSLLDAESILKHFNIEIVLVR